MVNNVKKEIELYDKMCGWLQVYLEDKYKDTDAVKASKKMFDECNVVYREYKSKGKNIIITV